jgi:hypothetical protein
LSLTFTIFADKFVSEIQSSGSVVKQESFGNLESVLEIFEEMPQKMGTSQLSNSPTSSVTHSLFSSLEKILIGLSKNLQNMIIELNPLVKDAVKKSRSFWSEDDSLNQKLLELERFVSLAVRITNLTQNIRHNLMLLMILK